MRCVVITGVQLLYAEIRDSQRITGVGGGGPQPPRGLVDRKHKITPWLHH